MKSKHLLLLMLLAVFAPWAVKAQETLTVYDQGGSTTSSYVPFWGNWADNSLQCEMVYPSTILSNLDGSTITNLHYYTNGTDNISTTSGTGNWDGTFTIFMKEVESTTINAWSGTTGATIVYEGQIPLVNGEMTIELSTPYDYDGGNLLVGFYYTTGGHYKSEYFLGETVNGASIYGRSGQSYSVNSGNFLPKTTFTYEQGGDVCEKPATLVAENLTGNSATLTWTGGSGVYNIELNGTIIEENYEGYTYSLTGLAATTAYTAKVQSVCDGSTPTSTWKSVSFTTPCASYDIPYTYGFEDAAPFGCWTVISGNITRMSGTANNGSSYRLDFRGTTSNMIALPQFNEATNNLRVEFYTRPESTASNCGKFAIGYMTDITDASTFVAVETYPVSDWSTASYVKKTVDFVNVPANANIAMRQFDCSTNYYWYVDDVIVKEMPSCLPPTGLAANASTTSAELSWTANSGETAWTVYYKKTSDATYSSVAANTNPFTLPGLTSATNYQYYVVANCAADDTSEPSEDFPFTTECDVLTIDENNPYTENFDGYTLPNMYTPNTHQLPICWDYINECSNNTYNIYPTMHYYTSGTNYNSSPNYVRFYSYASSYSSSLDPQPQYAILPEMQNVSGLRIKLYAKAQSTATGYDGIFKVGVMEGNTFVQVGDPITTSTTYNQFIIPFNTYSGTGTRIAIMIEAAETPASGSAYRIVYIDDITVEPIPSCVEPSGLDVVANSITPNSVQLTWTAGGTETAWDICCTTSAEAPTAATTPTVTGTTDNPCTVSGLNASTHYYAYVRARCSDSDQSPWSAAKEFDTECETVTTFPFSQDFNSLTVANTIPLCWDNNDGTTTSPSYKWCYNTKSSSNEGSSANGHEGKCIVFDSYNNNSNNTNFLKTPVMNFPAGKIMQLNFWYKNPAGGDFSVFISTDGGVTYTTALATNLRYQSSWAEKEIVLNDYVGTENVVIVFKGTSNYGNGDAYIYLDDVVIAEAPTCIKPSALKCDSKTAHTATLSWTNGEEGQNNWVIAYSTNPDFDPDDPEVTLQGTLTNPVTIEGLSQSTTYYAYVRADCGVEEGLSAWCNTKVTFTTLAGNVTPTGLAVAPTSITSSQATASWNAVAGNTLHQSYDIYWDLATVTSVPAEPAAPNLISGITATSQDITGLNPETSYKVWVRDNCGTDGYSSWSSAVTFSTVSACQTPDGLAESNVTNNSATITWNTYGLTDFNLRYSTDGTTWTTVENVNSPYTFDNTLTANTAYQVQVQATCADAETWSTVLNFRTECDAITITDSYSWTEDFETPVTTASYNTSTASLIIMPYCWDNYSDNTSSYVYAKPHLLNANAGTSGYNYSSPASQVLYFYGSGNGYAALPEFTNALSELQISFKWASESNANGALTLGYITSEDDGTYNTFTAIGESFAASNASSKQMKSETVYLNEVPATATRLVFRWYYSGQWGANIDDVEVALMPSCYPVGTLAATDVLATTAKLSWALVDDTQTAWQVCLNGDEDHLVAANTHENFLLENLSPETAYTVKVRANCGDSQGEWSNEVNFTTLEACPAPSNLAASNLTQNTADLTWTGESDSYNIQYCKAPTFDAIFTEDFENGVGQWAFIDCETEDLYASANHTEGGSNGYSFLYNSNPPQYLVSPEITGITEGMKLEFWYKNSSTSWQETFYIGTSATTGTTADEIEASFTFGDVITASDGTWHHYSKAIPADTKYICWKLVSNNKLRLYIDDIQVGSTVTYTPQTIEGITTNSYPLTELASGSEYEVKVQGVCGGTAGNWSSTYTFTTMAEGNKVFTNATTDGKWGTAGNWVPAGAPALTDEVIIRANATIESTCVAEANNITFEGTTTPTLTIEDGGQLIHNNEGVHAIVKKNIAGYNTSTTNGGWYFISSPIMSSSSYDFGITPSAAGLITDNFGNNIPDGETATYDLYRFVESPGNDLEWKNYRNNSFNLDRTVGYLYANVNDVALSFDGVIRRSDQNVTAGLDNTSGASFAGWNLMGNPFTCKAYSSLPYYVIDGSGTRLNMTAVLATEPIDVCTGVMVNGSGSMTFSRNPQESANNGNVQMTLSQQVVNRDGTSTGLTTIDNAIVSFNESDLLEKFVFNSSLSKLYIQQDGKDYAIVASEGQGTLPVNFKATENGTYTLNFNVEGVEMSYLHLIDNMTGNDVDLLQTPSYTFDALTTDYESRFKLVFATGNAADDSFAFYSNGNWIINNDGQATLQVIDVTGRILSSETVNGSVSTTINAAPGVYMLRLVNGDNVKVQKVVVR